MTSAALTETAGKGLALAWRAAAIVLFAAGLGWLAGGTNVPLLTLSAMGVVALCGVLLSPSWLALATMILVPFTGIIATQFVGVIAGNTNLTDAALAAFAVSAVSHRPPSSRPRSMPVVPTLLGVALIAVILAGLLNSPDLGSSVNKVGRIALAAVLILAAYRSLTRDDAKRCARALVLSTTAACLMAFAITIAKAPQAGEGLRLWAGLVDPNGFGILVGVVLVLAVVGVQFKTKAAWAGVIIILFVAEVATLSRSGAIVIAVGMATLVLGVALAGSAGLRMRVSSRLLILILLSAVAVAGLTVFVPGLADRAGERLQEGMHPSEDASGALRIQAVDAGLQVLEEDPLLGTGPGTFRAATAQAQGQGARRAVEAHNSLLESTVEFGIVAGFCIAGLMAWGIIKGGAVVRRLGATGEESTARTALAAWAALIAGLAGSLLLANFLYQGAFMAVCIIMIAAASPDADAPSGPVRHPE